MTAGATAAAAAAAAIAEAIKASGTLVRLAPHEWWKVVERQEAPLVIVRHRTGIIFGERHEYLTSYRGFAFYTTSSQPIALPAAAEVVEAKSIWMPG